MPSSQIEPSSEARRTCTIIIRCTEIFDHSVQYFHRIFLSGSARLSERLRQRIDVEGRHSENYKRFNKFKSFVRKFHLKICLHCPVTFATICV
jgi:hypothetical protein